MANTFDSLKDKAKSAVKKKLGIDSGSGTLVKLKIGKQGSEYEVLLNPNQLSHSLKIGNTETEKNGIPKPESNDTNSTVKKSIPTSIGPESLSFELMLDGTGAIGMTADVSTEISNLAKACVEPLSDAKDREEGINISWGSIIEFKGHLQSFDTTYSLFKPDGTPLRAVVKLAFSGTSGLTKIKNPIKRGDKTKEVDIDTAKTIVNACSMVYNSPVAYIAVAKANKLTNVRKLKPGSKLTFPPKKD